MRLSKIKGMIHRHSIQHSSPISHKRTDVVRLSNGKTIVYSTNYLNNKPTDKLVRVFNKMGEWIHQKYEIFKNGKKQRIL